MLMTTLTLTKKDGSEVEVQASTVQAPGARLGQHSLNGHLMIASPVVPGAPVGDINPATGAFYTQVGPRPATQISPPPSRRFDGR